MDNAGYAALTRQSALLDELRVVANNIANASTTGYRREGIVFSEFVVKLESGTPPMSMARPAVRATSSIQGELAPTGGALDFAIEGPGFFPVETPDGGIALTRNGAFTASATNELVTMDGLRVLDAGGVPIFIPPDGTIALSSDGTLSVDNQPLTQIGLFRPVRPEDTLRGSGTLFTMVEGAIPDQLENPSILQGFLETSNVDPISEMARLIEVQRAYEAGQDFLKSEDERKRQVVATIGQLT